MQSNSNFPINIQQKKNFFSYNFVISINKTKFASSTLFKMQKYSLNAKNNEKKLKRQTRNERDKKQCWNQN